MGDAARSVGGVARVSLVALTREMLATHAAGPSGVPDLGITVTREVQEQALI